MASTIAALSAASNPKEDFASSWEGQTVVLKRPLYTIGYRERGLFGSSSDKRDGLVVVTPFIGTYLQFDGRQSKNDVRGADPQGMMDTVREAYAKDALDVGHMRRSSRSSSPVPPRVELVVSSVRIDRDRLRLFSPILPMAN